MSPPLPPLRGLAAPLPPPQGFAAPARGFGPPLPPPDGTGLAVGVAEPEPAELRGLQRWWFVPAAVALVIGGTGAALVAANRDTDPADARIAQIDEPAGELGSTVPGAGGGSPTTDDRAATDRSDPPTTDTAAPTTVVGPAATDAVTTTTAAPGQAAPPSTSPPPPPPPTTAVAPPPTAAPTTTAAPVPGSVEAMAVESGWSSVVDPSNTRVTTAAAVVYNDTSQSGCGLVVEFTLLDGAGNPQAITTERVEFLPAGQYAVVAPLLFGYGAAAAPASMTVRVVGADGFTNGGFDQCAGSSTGHGVTLPTGGLAVSGVGFVQVTGQVTNTTATLLEFANVDCVFRAGGVIVGGEPADIVDPIAPGATAGFEVYASYLPAGVDLVECQVTG